MFIKIDKERVINTDQLVVMVPVEALLPGAYESLTREQNAHLKPDEIILVMTRHNLITTSAIAAYISQMVDAADGFTEATDKPQELSLQSQIAILLKNRKEGLTLTEIQNEFHLRTDDKAMELAAALNELDANGVVVTEINNLDTLEPRYYHAANTTTDVDF